MTKQQILKKIITAAKRDERNRKDPRFLDTIGFLVAKGFLKVNFPVAHLPNKRLQIEDAIWAGKNVEPRILEVLPVAVLRLGRHFDFDPEKHKALVSVLDSLRKNTQTGEDFFGVPFDKLKQWRDLTLIDGRTKILSDRKTTKTFRLKPTVVARLAKMAKAHGCTETAYLEQKILEG